MDQFVGQALDMDDHGYGDKAGGYARLIEQWHLRPELATQLTDYFWAHYDGLCHLSEDTALALETLKSHGKRLGIITNGGTHRQRSKIDALGLSALFDTVLISEAEGIRKPAAEIFLRAVHHCGVEPSEAAFVGDHPETDVEGAKNAGLLPIWKHVPYWSPGRDDVFTVRQLSEILPLCL